jgi:OmpA-OmpF porin, OOP family
MMGSVEANYKLSLVRSKVCADYLASYGIDRNRIKLEAYSKLQPAADPAEDRLQWKNRRVEVVLEH